jgi:hypothetical protein
MSLGTPSLEDSPAAARRRTLGFRERALTGKGFHGKGTLGPIGTAPVGGVLGPRHRFSAWAFSAQRVPGKYFTTRLK